MTPEARLRSEIFWDAAKACESRHELPAFNECYREGMRTQIEARRKAGLTVPEMPQEPTADLD